MNQKQAIARLSTVLDKSFAYRTNPKAPDAEQREVIRAAYRLAKHAHDDAVIARDARRAALLQDPEYRTLCEHAKATETAMDKAGAGLYSHRVTVGQANSRFFHVKAEGDNWAEVVEKVCKS